MTETPKISPDLKQEEAKKLDLNQLIEQSLANHGLNKVEGLEIKRRFEQEKTQIAEETKNLLNGFLSGLKNGEWGGLRQAFDNYEKAVPEEAHEQPRETEEEIQKREAKIRDEQQQKAKIEAENKRVDKLKNDKVNEINKNEELQEKIIDEIDKLELKKDQLSNINGVNNKDFEKWFAEFDKDEGVTFDDIKIEKGEIKFSLDDNWFTEEYNEGKSISLKECLDNKGEFSKEKFIEKVKSVIPDVIKNMPKEEEKKQEQKK